MATDVSSPPNTPTQPAMEDILSSIRTGVVEETAKVGNGSADLIDAAAAQDGEDDVLELSAEDMVPVASGEAAGEDDELIDIAAFGASGEAKPVDKMTAAEIAADILGDAKGAASVVAAPVETGGAADEFDRLLAEISQDQLQQVAAAEVSKQVLMAEEEPLGAETAEELVEDASEDVVAPDAAEEPLADVPAEAVELPVSGVAPQYSLGTVQGADGGVQIALPAEVLAMALRPMVQDWLAKNLAGVVEKLVKDEISKLTQN